MPSRLQSRFAAPLLIAFGFGLFGVGAVGLPRIDVDRTAAQQAPPQQHRLVRVSDHQPDRCGERRQAKGRWT